MGSGKHKHLCTFKSSCHRPAIEPIEPRVLLNASLCISEFMAINDGPFVDGDNNTSDWIEIHNNAAILTDLNGWYLTDDPTDLQKWPFPDIALGSDQYLLIFASGADTIDHIDTTGYHHANFKLSGSGEYLALVQGTTVMHQYITDDGQYPEQQSNISYGLSPEDNTEQYFTQSTPGTENNTSYISYVDDVQFSEPHGYYQHPFLLTLSTSTEGAQIRYTLDGNKPSATAGFIYSQPILIESNTPVRAIAYKGGYQDTPVTTQTYLFLDDILTQTRPDDHPETWSGSNPSYYDMCPDIVNDPAYQDLLPEAFSQIPTMSLVIKYDDMFGDATGIYTHTWITSWEREVSMEMIYPDDREGFQVNAGIEIHGAISRHQVNQPKNSFRVKFKNEYGPSKLDFPLFGDDANDQLNEIVLRAGSQDSWSFAVPVPKSQYIRDQFMRDTGREIGSTESHGEFVHLFINGLYWGVYNPAEHIDADFIETYFGGEADQYDVIKEGQVESGDVTAWNEMIALADIGAVDDDAYQALLQTVDVDSLMKHILLGTYFGNLDWPYKGYVAFKPQTEDGKFKFVMWDAELGLWDLTINRVVQNSPNSPARVFHGLKKHDDFKLMYADFVHQMLFNGGPLSIENNIARYTELADRLESSMVAESARWGEYRVLYPGPNPDNDPDLEPPLTPYSLNDHWYPERDWVLNTFLTQRHDVYLAQLRAVKLYPNVSAASFSQHGGTVEKNHQLTINAPSGVIYYTTDGSEPMEGSQTLTPGQTITLSQSAIIKARVLDNGQWSALNQAAFAVDAPSPVIISEINYHPNGDGLHEFIEIANITDQSVFLGGMAFTNGIDFQFPDITLDPGQHVLVVRNLPAFTEQYSDTLPVIGTYDKSLDNGGETLILIDVGGQIACQVDYDDTWYPATDGLGKTLIALDPDSGAENLQTITGWRASPTIGGSPGLSDPIPGDANNDGVVSLLDLDALGRNYGLDNGTATLAQGDFNGDGNVTLIDLDILGRFYQSSTSTMIRSDNTKQSTPATFFSNQSPNTHTHVTFRTLETLFEEDEQTIDLFA